MQSYKDISTNESDFLSPLAYSSNQYITPEHQTHFSLGNTFNHVLKDKQYDRFNAFIYRFSDQMNDDTKLSKTLKKEKVRDKADESSCNRYRKPNLR